MLRVVIRARKKVQGVVVVVCMWVSHASTVCAGGWVSSSNSCSAHTEYLRITADKLLNLWFRSNTVPVSSFFCSFANDT